MSRLRVSAALLAALAVALLAAGIGRAAVRPSTVYLPLIRKVSGPPSVNQPPTFNFQNLPVVVNEDSAPFDARIIVNSTPVEPNQAIIAYLVSTDRPSLFSIQPSISISGLLSFTPAPDAAGEAVVTVRARDNGGTANGGSDLSDKKGFRIIINAVNDAPSFNPIGAYYTSEDSGPVTHSAITNSTPVEPNQAIIGYLLTNDQPDLFSVQPTISISGVLSFTPAPNAFGFTTVAVRARDNGGTANGGSDTSTPHFFDIGILSINDPPIFTPGGDITIFEDAGSFLRPWATNIAPGPPNEKFQTAAFFVSTANRALFTKRPAISRAGILTFTPIPDAFGTTTVTVDITDFMEPDTEPVTFQIAILGVNDAPSFELSGVLLTATDTTTVTIANFAMDILPGPTNEHGQAIDFEVEIIENADLLANNPSIRISNSGTLTFRAAAARQGTARLRVRLRDNGGTADGGHDTSEWHEFQIQVDTL